jgi:DNA-binding LytR/AlgR family response regulator
MNQKKLNCIIVDDDDLAIRLLADFVAQNTQLNLVQRFDDAREAQSFLQTQAIDVLFVDIQMPYLTGLELVEQLAQKPAIIITTSYPQFALEGFRLSVVDYLLKPYLSSRFEEAVQKALDYCQYQQILQQQQQPDYLFVKADNKMVKIFFNDIVLVEGWKQYVKIHTTEKFVLTLDSMKNMEALLPANQFMRIHKSFIINKQKVTAFSGTAISLGKHQLPIGKTYKNQAEQLFG